MGAEQAEATHRLEIILKVAERCNINCTYCYVFNGADDSFRYHPRYISDDTIKSTAAFLLEGVASHSLRSIQIDFHGGEPLLLGKRRFEAMCEHFRHVLEPAVDLTLCLQTNATLVDHEWIDIFERHNIRVGLSLDGPAEYHDKARVDFKNQGTYAKVIHGLHLLGSALAAGRIHSLGVLCVINPAHSASRIYHHFVSDLGIKTMDFLLPDVTHDNFSGYVAKDYGYFLCDLFDTWVADDDPDIQVRVLNSVLSLLLGGSSWVSGYGLVMAPAITIASDGSLGPDDLLRACGPEMMQTGANVATTKLSDFLNSRFIQELKLAHSDYSMSCQSCPWLQICGGGLMVNRYKRHEGFKHASVFCEGLKLFYGHVTGYLLAKGLPLEHLQQVLFAPRSLVEA